MIDPADLHIWADDVAEHDYQAAINYLTCKQSVGDRLAAQIASDLKHAKLRTRRANDILRACRLQPAPLSDPGVHKDLLKLLSGKKLSPVLLAMGDVADGFHRVSLAYWLSPYLEVPHKCA